MWKNVRVVQATDENMDIRIAWPKATNTHSEYVLLSSTVTMVARTPVTVNVILRFLSLLISIVCSAAFPYRLNVHYNYGTGCGPSLFVNMPFGDRNNYPVHCLCWLVFARNTQIQLIQFPKRADVSGWVVASLCSRRVACVIGTGFKSKVRSLR
jgi:hypothetical protein